jgi:hypothetical protein
MPASQGLFEREGDLLRPTSAALGPWRPDALHGGAVSALLGDSLGDDDWTMARMTMDLLRRVPAEPLRLVKRAATTTRRMLRTSVELWCDDRLVAKAEALSLAKAVLELPPQSRSVLEAPTDLDDEPLQYRDAIVDRVGYPSFVSEAVATRRQRLDPTRPHAFAYWLRLLLPAVVGEDVSPIQRVCAAADYANGGFTNLSFEEWSFVSLDLTVQLVRSPVGDWVAVTNDSLAESTGVGLGDAELYDIAGRIGRATASLLVEKR